MFMVLGWIENLNCKLDISFRGPSIPAAMTNGSTRNLLEPKIMSFYRNAHELSDKVMPCCPTSDVLRHPLGLPFDVKTSNILDNWPLLGSFAKIEMI